MSPYNFIHDFTSDVIEIFNKYRYKQNNSLLKLRFSPLLSPAFRTDIDFQKMFVQKTLRVSKTLRVFRQQSLS